MANPIDTACPNCQTTLRVPAELAGKKVKCKKCQTVFAVAATAKPAAAKPASAKPVAARPAKAKPAGDENAPIKFAKEEAPPAHASHHHDDEDDANPYAAIKENEAARCPHCAKEMDPPDAMICLNCGYDLRHRHRKESRNVIELTFADYLLHHIGAFFLLLFVIAINILAIICWLNMTAWVGPWVENDETNAATGEKQHYVKPWCFSLWIELFVIWVSWKCLKFIFRRFFIDYTPPEKIMEKKED
ncbi:MAG: MJ0042-type zinc finger domain-containing protein [Gemmataceae bacterium]